MLFCEAKQSFSAVLAAIAVVSVSASAMAQTKAEYQKEYYTLKDVQIQSVDEELGDGMQVRMGDFWGASGAGATKPANPADPFGPGNSTFPPFPSDPGTGGGVFDPFPSDPGNGGVFFPPFPGTEPQAPSAVVQIDQIVNLGKKIWDLIKTGKPVVNVQVDVASGVPQGITDWRSLDGWQTPRSRLVRMSYKNGFDMDVVDFTYRMVYTYGGSFDGRGKYLSQVSVVPANLQVAWGYEFDAKTSVPNLVNVGTKADPMAGMEVLVQWKIQTVFKHEQNTHALFVRGDGSVTDLTDGR